MLSLDQGSQISIYVQQTILSWVKLYPQFQNTKQLLQLTTGNFFLSILQSLPNFKLLNPIYQLNQQNNLASKVNIIKNISKSLIKYHQIQLLRDVSQLDINYVQLCMGNKKQLFRFITILFSALCSHKISRQILYQKILQMNIEQAQILKIMIENSLNIGQECGSCSSRSWKLSQQKKVFAKMQILQNKIQQLQIINLGLQQKIKSYKQSQQISNKQIKKLKQQINKILTLNEQLVDTNEKTINQLKLSTIQQTSTKKKLQLIKSKLQDKIIHLQLQIQKIYKQKQQLLILLQKYTNIIEINKQIKQQNQILRQQINKLEIQKLQYKKINKIHNQQFIQLKKHCSQLEIKIQELSLICSSNSNYNCKSDSIQNNYKTCYFGNKVINQNQQGRFGEMQESNKYRVKQNLDWINNYHSYNIEEQNNNPNTNININMLNFMRNSSNFNNDNKNKFEIRTITQRSLQDSNCFSQIKQNQSIIMNNSQIIQSFANKDSNNIQKLSRSVQNNLQNISKQQYRKINGKLQQQYMEQIKVLTCVILDLQSQLEQARKRSHNVYFDNNSSLTISRMQKFKTKVKQMFGKNTDSITLR